MIYCILYCILIYCILYSIILVLEYGNFDLCNIQTPVDVDIFEKLLIQSKFDPEKTAYLVNGFRHGFSLRYEGPTNVQRKAPNLKLRVGSHLELWNKVMTEVKAQRYAGPFEEIPFEYFIQSPIGLVPKDKGKKTRLIFHLSFPKNGDSVNSGIPKEYCTVQYPDFEQAVKVCIAAGKSCHIAKSDMSMVFRNVPLKKDCWYLLILKAVHSVTGKTYFFVDKCLPFGSSISCKIFQDFSDSVAHIVRSKTHKPLVNYLDDYLFAAFLNLCAMHK